nr:hypothetical protein A5482_12115 [Cyanobacterium sp. IPPAS B-1200]
MININKTVQYTLISVGGLLMTSSAVYGANLNLDWNNTTFVAGGLNQTFSVGQGEVNLQFSLKNGSSFASFERVSTPRLTQTLTGTNPGVSLHLQRKPSTDQNNRGSIELKTSFLRYNKSIVKGLTFDIFDIDRSANLPTSGTPNPSTWQDRVIVKGFLGGNEVTPTFTIFDTNNVRKVGDFTLDGIRNVGNTANGGNVRVSFADSIDSFILTFTDNPSLVTTTSPSSHGIGIGSMSFQTVPEPSMMSGLLLFGFLGLAGSKKKSSN